MVSASGLAVLALSATAVVAYPKAHGAYYGHQRYHASGIAGTGNASPTGGYHHHHNGTYNGTYSESLTTKWVTVTVYPVDESTTPATTFAAPTTGNAVQHEGGCQGGATTQTVTSTSTIYVTVTVEPSSTTADAITTTTVEETTTSTASEAASSTVDPVYTSPTTAAPVTTTAATSGAGQFYGGTSSQATSQAAATTSAAGSGYSGSKKGLSFTDATDLAMFGKSDSSWAYNWGSSPGSAANMPEGVKYVPMCWGKNSASECASVVQKAVQNYGADTVLSFNEPDLPAQANLSPQEAYQLHVDNVAKPLAGTVKIGSPAVTNSGTSGQGLDWMKSFLELCNSNGSDACKLDFLAVHWYATATSFEYFKDHMTEAVKLAEQYGVKGVWLTEFAATECTQAEEAEFLTKAMTWLESDDAAKIERYAYFIAGSAAGLGMVSNAALNAVGQAYNVAS